MIYKEANPKPTIPIPVNPENPHKKEKEKLIKDIEAMPKIGNAHELAKKVKRLREIKGGKP